MFYKSNLIQSNPIHILQYASYFQMKQLLSCVIFKSLGHFMVTVFLFILITFERFLTIFGGFGKVQKSKMADQDGRHSVIMTQLLPHVM